MVIHVQNQVLAHDGQTDQRNISSSFHKFILKSDFQPSLIQGIAASEFLPPLGCHRELGLAGAKHYMDWQDEQEGGTSFMKSMNRLNEQYYGLTPNLTLKLDDLLKAHRAASRDFTT
jgi:hypothetical protein